VPARGILARVQLPVRDPLHELVEFVFVTMHLSKALQARAIRIAPRLRPFRPGLGGIVLPQTFKGRKTHQRIALLLPIGLEIRAALWGGGGPEAVVSQTEAGDLGMGDADVSDHVRRAQRVNFLVESSRRGAREFRNRLDVDIERIEIQPAVGCVGAGPFGAFRKQCVERIQADPGGATRRREADELLEIAEIAVSPVASRAHRVELHGKRPKIGVATYAHELFSEVADLDTVYVPIGLGSGICGVIGVRDALGLATHVVGVVAERANAYARSFAAERVVSTDAARTFADGMAVRVPDEIAFATIRRGAERIVEVSEHAIADAIRIYFSDTHTLAEGAGAAPLAALLREQDRMKGRRVGLIMTGQNIDRARMAAVLAGQVPEA
jgi:hypothetical protein